MHEAVTNHLATLIQKTEIEVITKKLYVYKAEYSEWFSIAAVSLIIIFFKNYSPHAF